MSHAIAFEHGVRQNRPRRLYRVTVTHDFADDNPKNDFQFTDYFTNKAEAEKRADTLRSMMLPVTVTTYEAIR